MTNKLNQRLEYHTEIPCINEVGANSTKTQKLKTVFCEIKEKLGKSVNYKNSDVEKVESIILIKTRAKSLKNPKVSDFFYCPKRKLKYEIISFIPDFENNEFLEFKCKSVKR